MGLQNPMQFPWNINFCNLMQDAALLWGGGRGGREGVGGRGREGVGGNLLFLLLQYIARKNAPIRNRKCIAMGQNRK